MKRHYKFIAIVIVIVLHFGSLIFIKTNAVTLSKTQREPTKENFSINSKIKIRKLKLKSNTYILDYKQKDVNGDNVKDDVLLVGVKKDGPASVFSEDINIIIKDGKTKKYTKISPGKINSGYNAVMFLGDFNGDKIADMFIDIGNDKESSTSTFSLISFKDNKIYTLFDQVKFSLGLCFDIKYKDGFKVNIFNKAANKNYQVDISDQKEGYIQEGVYDETGKLLSEMRGKCCTFKQLKPVDEDNDGTYELVGFQKLCGANGQDSIGYGRTMWKYNKCRFILTSIDIETLNN